MFRFYKCCIKLCLGNCRFGHYHRSKVISTGLVMFPVGSITQRKFWRLPTSTKCSLFSKFIYRKCFCNFLAVEFIGIVNSLGFIRRANNFVQIIPLLESNWNLFSDSIQMIEVYVRHDNVLGLLRGGNDLAPRTDHAGVTPGHVGGLGVAGGAGRGHVHLVVQSPGPWQQFPVCRSW